MSTYLEEVMEEIDFSSIEQFMQGHMRTEMSFEKLVSLVATEGLDALNAENITTLVFDSLFYELSMAQPMFVKMLVFTLLFSVIQRFLVTKNKYISDMGFLFIYATLLGLLMQSFLMVKDVAIDGINTLLTFLNALIPTYAVSMVISGHGVTGAMIYEVAFGLVYLVELLTKVILSPLVHVFVLVTFLNHLFDEDKLSKLANFLEHGIQLALKTAFGAVIGLSVVQSMLTPAKDMLADNTILSGLSAIPGIGNTLGATGDVILSCGMLIKNSIGVVGLLILAFLAVVPVVQVGLFNMMYQLLSIILQPIADKRITECISGVARGASLYLKMIVYTMMLFFVLFSMVSVATSMVR